MPEGDLPLAPTLQPLGDDPRAGLRAVAEGGFRFVQLSATQRGLRPADLDRTGRRDLNAALRRMELICSGLDSFIPTEHFLRADTVDRAVAAVTSAIELAEDLGRVAVSINLPTDTQLKEADDSLIIDAIAAAADRCGVSLADHALPIANRDGIGVGVDPAAYLGANEKPDEAVMAHAGKLISCRLGDLLTTGMRGPLGLRTEGRLDVMRYKIALSVAGYQKPVVIDARQWLKPWEGVERTKQVWDRTAALPFG